MDKLKCSSGSCWCESTLNTCLTSHSVCCLIYIRLYQSLDSFTKLSSTCFSSLCFMAIRFAAFFGFALLRSVIGQQNTRHVLNQSAAKPKPIVTCSHAFSRAWRLLHVFDSISDWFITLFASVVIGQGNYFGFGFTTLKRKPV